MAPIRSATLEVLNSLSWRLELASRPTLPAWLQTYDDWMTRQLDKPAMKRLQALGFLDKNQGGTYQMTSKGQLSSSHALDVEARWKRTWNNEWCFLTFDVNAKDWRSRTRLQRWLKEENFGKLQGSIWICPDFDKDLRKIFRAMEIADKSFFLFKGRDVLSLIDEDTIEKAWNFDRIRQAYRDYIDWAEPVFSGHVPEVSFLEWQSRELKLWRKILELDPFLPETLCPTDYPGRRAWKLRKGLRKSQP